MPTVKENLETAKANFAAKLAEISEDPKPDYVIDGQTVSWVDLMRFLTESISGIDAQLSSIEPYEIHTTGYSP